MPSRVPRKLTLSWLLNNATPRDVLQYGNQHKAAVIIGPTGNIAPGLYSHTSKNVVYDLRVTETSAEPAPILPPVLTVTEDDPELDVSWTLPDSYNQLFLERSEDGVTGWTLLATLPGTQTTYDDAAVTVGVEEFYRIRGSQGGAYSAYSNIDSGLLVAAGFALFGVGHNDLGQLGVNDTTDRTSLTEETTNADAWVQVSSGLDFTIARRDDRTLWFTGDNSWGLRGDGTTSGSNDEFVQIGSATDWATFSCGQRSVYAIKTDGTLWAWGYDLANYLSGLVSTPTQIGSATDWLSVSIQHEDNNYYAFGTAIKTDGTLWILQGLNSGGTLGDWEQEGSATNWTKCSTGRQHIAAINSAGELWTAGRNRIASGPMTTSGPLGLGFVSATFAAEPLTQVSGSGWADVSCGQEFTLARKTDGTIWATGTGTHGELGSGGTGSVSSFTQIGSDTTWSAISAGEIHSLALKSDASLLAWGSNIYGQQGNGGTGTDVLSPTQVGSDTDWQGIAGSTTRTFALKAA